MEWEGLDIRRRRRKSPISALSLRSKPLNPTTCPFAAIDAFTHSRRGSFKPKDEFTRAQLALLPKELDTQVARLLRSVLRYEEDPCGCSKPADDGAAERVRRRAELSKLQIRWDVRRCRYTSAEGQHCLRIAMSGFRGNHRSPGGRSHSPFSV